MSIAKPNHPWGKHLLSTTCRLCGDTIIRARTFEHAKRHHPSAHLSYMQLRSYRVIEDSFSRVVAVHEPNAVQRHKRTGGASWQR